jgi:hypothetical protein
MELVPFRGRNEWIARSVVSLDGVPMPPIDQIVELSPIVRGSRFTVRLLDRPMGQPVETQLDGEEWIAASSFRVEVARHALRLIVPA